MGACGSNEDCVTEIKKVGSVGDKTRTSM